MTASVVVRSLLEVAASVAALVMVVFLFGNAFLHSCAMEGGTVCDVDPGGVATYRWLLGGEIAAVVVTLTLAGWRRARLTWIWHGVVTLAVVAACVLFSYPPIQLHHTPAPRPADPSSRACFSGSPCPWGG